MRPGRHTVAFGGRFGGRAMTLDVRGCRVDEGKVTAPPLWTLVSAESIDFVEYKGTRYTVTQPPQINHDGRGNPLTVSVLARKEK